MVKKTQTAHRNKRLARRTRGGLKSRIAGFLESGRGAELLSSSSGSGGVNGRSEGQGHGRQGKQGEQKEH
eukprot:1322697-Alexandrium_andersonii.AAC.1